MLGRLRVCREARPEGVGMGQVVFGGGHWQLENGAGRLALETCLEVVVTALVVVASGGVVDVVGRREEGACRRYG